MRIFNAEDATEWVATAREEATPRHHGRWYLLFHTRGDDSTTWPMPEVRWQTFQSADRTLATMSVFELRRRLATVLARAPVEPPAH